MKKPLNFASKIPEFSNTPLPGIPLVEILGNHRVLIENHYGMIGYDEGKISVKVKRGCVDVCGSKLSLSHMSDSSVIINGYISSIHLCYADRYDG